MSVAEQKFQIPSELSSKLRFVEPLDKRSDNEIIQYLSSYSPIKGEKNIWTYWDSGFKAMPGWCQRNVINWARLCGPSWNIHVLDSVAGSPNHFLNWIDKDLLPDALVNNEMEGQWAAAHSSDFLRGSCLYKYGGVCLDTGIILIRKLDSICWKQLEDDSSPFRIAKPFVAGPKTASHFTAARKGDPFIKAWHDLFLHLWKGQKSSKGIEINPLIAFYQNVNFRASGYNWEFKVDPHEIIHYLGLSLSWMRLGLIDGGDGNQEINWAQYAKDHILYFDALQENWGAQTIVGFRGQSQFDALATKLDGVQSENYTTAYKLVWRLLIGSSMQKISHGKGLTQTPELGLLWELPEFQNKDIEPGTFAELLRYGSVHFEQSRTIEYVDYRIPDSVMHKGLYEA
ncbi:hypothetical protein H072_3764 [Dactylellina haptotyla CBS 200.50]|uniref:Capsule polysaccharide biosynthesis protein n=1 Tax=Dactylellina haptotyla (strain CBS 200.50) TaxID=1284197 RepID=S8AGV6_DACHA|nr:hypothetical protein H072_3764 [Dactylellina haptotyla CBS 200.50]